MGALSPFGVCGKAHRPQKARKGVRVLVHGSDFCHCCTKKCTILVAKKNKKFVVILLKADNKSVTIISQGRENDLCF